MRVVHVDAGRQMRGGQWQVLYLLGGLRGAGHECRLLAPSGSPLLRAAEAAGIAVESLSWSALRRRCRQAEVTHAHDARSHTLAVLAGARPLVVSRRVAFPAGDSWLSRWKYRRADRYAAVSRHVAAQLEKAGVLRGRIAEIPDGVPLLLPSRRTGGVVAPATQDPRKGSALLREAAKMAGVEVRFSGELERELADAAALVYLTYEEGLGSAVLLAMSAGVPVIASRVGGLREVIEDGKTGLLVDNDAAAVATAMRRLLEDGALAAAIATAGRQRVQEQFTVQHMVEATLRLYREVKG